MFKGQARDIREIGRILGARYVLEGSVRKAGNRVRLAAQDQFTRKVGFVAIEPHYWNVSHWESHKDFTCEMTSAILKSPGLRWMFVDGKRSEEAIKSSNVRVAQIAARQRLSSNGP